MLAPRNGVRQRGFERQTSSNTTPRQNTRKHVKSVAGFPADPRSSCTLMFSMQELSILDFGRSRRQPSLMLRARRQEGAHEHKYTEYCKITRVRAIPAGGGGAMG